MEDLEFEPPPILPDIKEQLRSYLCCPEKLPIHRFERSQEFWARKPDVSSLFFCEGSPLATTLKVTRDPNTGEIIEFKEVPINAAGATPQNSMSFNRAPAPPSDALRGSSSNIPFWPGSFPEPIFELPDVEASIEDEELLTVPPGFARGMTFKKDEKTLRDEADKKLSKKILDNTVNLIDLVQEDDDFLNIWKQDKHEDIEPTVEEKRVELADEEEVVPKELPVLHISTNQPTIIGRQKGTKYAVLLDSLKDIPDFREQIPEMAHEYPFELDNFQKQAILQLEKHNHVFVAAHTSAGKTVVAEYAIALSQKHMTRSIYTSPIKALSNQKYRDFKEVFDNVGLITGDFQINQTASCLIMTTEILRTMLYCGSDVTRDLEYVIFDEVHYISDKERGHVWEQVLIMLPRHVCVVLLSATVPNTIEFADWLGRTHEREVYVVSTYKRPVPLEHYLYTGSGGNSKNNRFLILDENEWKLEGYYQAKASLTSKGEKSYGFKQETTMWYALVDHLNKKELLPVVVFTFSRAKCDNNANSLRNLNLTNQREKYAIHKFFQDCVRSLKEPDRNIPQILRMQDILQRGIGVHHSGILPIIKEMVEMLFQKGLIKLLFATETFAMGVNMPARTVIFDSVTKHDGREKRVLLPAEYIQMAGRAGRRGKDKKGTVIILCKGEVPNISTLKDMMMGRPSQLISRFRLTYGMVLSLLRVESLSVEGMMSRSFSEAEHQKNMASMQLELKDVEKTLKEKYSGDLSSYLEPLAEFYGKTKKFLDKREDLWGNIITSSKAMKELCPGRILLITHSHHINKLAVILSSRTNNSSFRVLVLTDASDIKDSEKSDIWYKMIAISKRYIYTPVDTPNHTVLTIFPQDIFEVCGHKLKIDSDLIIKDWDKRQIPRFANDPPGTSCANAVQQLLELTLSAQSSDKIDSQALQALDLIRDLKLNDSSTYENIMCLYNLRDIIYDFVATIHISNFEEQFEQVFNKRILEDERNKLKFSLSDASMALYPEKEKRITLLRELKYVDEQNRVELKGKVACEMGMNELMVTELVLRNILAKMQPAEVAALLSCLVFQAKTKVEKSELVLTPALENGIKEIEDIFWEIQRLEEKYQISQEVETSLNFGLVEVVYEWASAKPFAEIMISTDVQEGIIVRCIQQLNETLCDVKNAARLIGDPELQNKMEEASTAIKRDIVFAASLYTQKETASL